MSEFGPHPTRRSPEAGEYLAFAMPEIGWEKAGACDGFDPAMFAVRVKGSRDPLNIAENFCADCSVVTECLAEDILNGVGEETVRGGVTRTERLRMHEAYVQGIPYVPRRTQGQYRSENFSAQMASWRNGKIEQIQTLVYTISLLDKQVEAGSVIKDGYYDGLVTQLESLQSELDFIQSEEREL